MGLHPLTQHPADPQGSRLVDVALLHLTPGQLEALPAAGTSGAPLHVAAPSASTAPPLADGGLGSAASARGVPQFEGRGVRVAIEADGPSHYAASGNTRHALGATLARNWHLGRLGWRVVCVHHSDWGALGGDSAAQQALLRAALADALRGPGATEGNA